MNEVAGKHLGQQGSYAIETDNYDPSLLVPMPRVEPRKLWGVDASKFVGVDVWHAHESTFLLNNGYPLAGTLKLIYPADSENIVESKSLKLYLNSFDMCKMGETPTEAIENYEKTITGHLLEILGMKNPEMITVTFHPAGLSNPQYVDSFEKFPLLEGLILTCPGDLHDMLVYDGDTRFLEVYEEEPVLKPVFFENKWGTHLLRSRCRVTRQKDSGSAFFHWKAEKNIHPISLLREVVGMRNSSEFHEPICEQLFQAVFETTPMKDLCIALLYARRGGIDINPIRATSWDLIPESFLNGAVLEKKTQMQ